MVEIEKSPYDFTIRTIRSVMDDTGVLCYVWSEEKNLEDDFGGLYVQSITGVRKSGKVKSVYSESFAESSKAAVYVSSVEALEQTKIELSVYFFESSGNLGVVNLNALRSAFEEEIQGAFVLFSDGMRQRKVLMYQNEEPEVFDEGLNGRLFIGIKYKFSSVYGKSFPLDDVTIDTDYASVTAEEDTEGEEG